MKENEMKMNENMKYFPPSFLKENVRNHEMFHSLSGGAEIFYSFLERKCKKLIENSFIVKKFTSTCWD